MQLISSVDIYLNKSINEIILIQIFNYQTILIPTLTFSTYIWKIKMEFYLLKYTVNHLTSPIICHSIVSIHYISKRIFQTYINERETLPMALLLNKYPVNFINEQFERVLTKFSIDQPVTRENYSVF